MPTNLSTCYHMCQASKYVCKLFKIIVLCFTMGNMRIDWISGRITIIRKDDDHNKGANSSYAPGNEEQTNPSVLSLIVKDGILQRWRDLDEHIVKNWSIRVFESKNPLVDISQNDVCGKAPFESRPAHGHHYILVPTSDYKQTFATMDVEQWWCTLVVMQDHLKWLYTQKGVSYVAIYADHDGTSSDDSKIHPHLNMLTFDMLPPTIAQEIKEHNNSQEKQGICPICLIIESDKSRRILQTENFIAFCPWSSSYPLEFCIAPKKHFTSFAKTSQKDLRDLALIIRAMLGGLTNLINDVSYSVAFHLSAEQRRSYQMHWHIEVYPATKKHSGVERGFGIHVNDVSSEDAAKKLAVVCKKELVNIVGLHN